MVKVFGSIADNYNGGINKSDKIYCLNNRLIFTAFVLLFHCINTTF